MPYRVRWLGLLLWTSGECLFRSWISSMEGISTGWPAQEAWILLRAYPARLTYPTKQASTGSTNWPAFTDADSACPEIRAVRPSSKSQPPSAPILAFFLPYLSRHLALLPPILDASLQTPDPLGPLKIFPHVRTRKRRPVKTSQLVCGEVAKKNHDLKRNYHDSTKKHHD